MDGAGSFFCTGGLFSLGLYFGFLGHGALQGNSIVLGIAIGAFVLGMICSAGKD